MKRYCKDCGRKVKPTKKFNLPLFIFGWLFTFGIVPVLYAIWYLVKFNTRCPICGARTKGQLWMLWMKLRKKQL